MTTSIIKNFPCCLNLLAEISKSPLRRDSCKRCSPSRSIRNTSPNSGSSDPEGKSKHQSLHFKQQFWRVMSWQGSSDDQIQLLKACSDKLADLKKKHKQKRVKYAEAAALSLPKIFFANRRPKRKSRSFVLGRSFSTKSEYEIQQDNLSKKKGSNVPEKQKDQISKKPVAKSRKFRKGGIVSLATVHKQNREETSNTEEGLENQRGKKKKNKKKLTQLHKHVKNAVHSVGIARMASKKSDKNSSM